MNSRLFCSPRLIRSLAFYLLLTLCFSPLVRAVPETDPEQKIHDFVDLLSSNEEVELAEKIALMSEAYLLDFVIVLTEDNEGLGHVAYADDFFDYNGYGYGPDDDGMLFLIDLEDRFLYISTHAAAHLQYFNDAAIEAVLDEAYPFASQDDYYGVCQAFLNAAVRHIDWVNENPEVMFTSPLDYLPKAEDYLLPNLYGGTQTKIDPEEKVQDLADILDYTAYEELSGKIAAMRSEYQLDFVIVLTHSTGGLSTVAYADDFYDYNGFGYGPNSDGMLFLVNLDARQLYISTHGTAHRVFFNDAAIDAVLDTIYPYASQSSFSDVCGAFLDAAARHIDWVRANPGRTFASPKDYIPIPTDPIGNLQYRLAFANEEYSQIAIFAGGISALLAGLYLFFTHKSSLPGAPAASSYISGAFQVTRSVDHFLHSHTTRSAIPKNNTSSGRGGGTSSHTSSSGRSHGGGGRSF